jgi:hypothetical protein
MKKLTSVRDVGHFSESKTVFGPETLAILCNLSPALAPEKVRDTFWGRIPVPVRVNSSGRGDDSERSVKVRSGGSLIRGAYPTDQSEFPTVLVCF